jgi:2-polyprenyl-3-methyl-5-hydroxy-6-metoxy-1,4-benzoquinol methylase
VILASPLSKLLRERFDPAFGRFVRFMARFELRRADPMFVRLAPHRREAMRQTALTFAPRVKELEETVVARDPEASDRYDTIVGEAFTRMREMRPHSAAKPSLADATPLLSAIERRLYRNAPEWLDDPSFPEQERTEALRLLDTINKTFGVYDGTIAALMPLIEAAERAGRRPVRVHDIASGHAGFAVLLKQALGSRVIVEASDIKPEYLQIGRARAEELGVRVDFYTEDALAMEGIRERGVDVVMCTQALHHFPPGMVARMIGQAARSARIGALFVDGERSYLMIGLFVPAASLLSRSYTLVHDGIVSLRRMYYKEELELLAELAPGVPPDAHVEAGRMLPAHAYLRVTRGANVKRASS